MALCHACVASPASRNSSDDFNFMSANMAQRPSSLFICPALRHPPIPQALTTPGIIPISPAATLQTSATPSSKFADTLGSISILHTEVSEESRAADEYMQRSAEESGRSTEDYERRALLFERGGQMVASSKLKGERVMMELELLQGEVLEGDEGRTAADYLQRAQIFSKSAEVFCKPVSP